MKKIGAMLKEPIFWFILVTMMFAVPLGHSFTVAMQASIIWPAIGLGFGFIVRFKTRAFLPLGLGYFFGYLIGLGLILELDFSTTLLQAFLRSITALLSLSLGLWFIHRLKLKGIINLKNILWFPVVAIIVALSATILGNFVLWTQGSLGWDDLVRSMIVWFLGDLFSILIFSSSLLAALYYDQRRSYRFDILRKEFLFYGAFLVFSTLIFNDHIGFLNYNNHKYLYLVFAFVVALVLPYRSFLIATFIFLVHFIIYPPFDMAFATYFYLIFDVNVFLLMIVSSIFLLKYMFVDLESERKSLDITARRLARLITSIQALMTLSSSTTGLDEHQKDAHAAKVFKMIFDMFSLFDYGACLIVKDGNIRFIDAIGHDLNYLNTLTFNPEKWIYNLDKPHIYREESGDLKAGIADKTIDSDKMKPLKESLLMSVKLSEDFIIEMSFDVAKGSSKTIDDKVYQYFESINILLNSFYESEVLALEQDEVKNSIISALLKVIGLFDEGTQTHSKSVGEIARYLGEAFELSTEHVQNLYWAGIVHDIGKIGISKRIVNKTGTYSVLEYEQMKKHVRLGYDLIAQSKNLMMIADLVAHHHERYDGEGYPNQIIGDDMTLDKHIIIMSEALGAMVHDWPYQKAKTKAAIIEELNKEKGHQFHPEVAEKTLELITQGLLDKLDR